MPNKQLNHFLGSKTGLTAGYIVAVALLTYIAVDIYYRYQDIRVMEAAISTANQTASASKPAIKNVQDTRQVAALYVFGKAKAKKKAPEPVKAPATRLKLTLIGIIDAEGTDMSRAIIRIDNKRTAVYSVGDALPKSKARVHEIQTGQILLKRNGKLESLAIERPELRNKDGKLISNDKGKSNVRVEDKMLMLPPSPAPSKNPKPPPPG